MMINAFDANEIDALNTIIIPQAQAEMEGIIKRELTATAHDEVFRLEHAKYTLPLPYAPIGSITEISIDATIVDAASYTISRDRSSVEFYSITGSVYPLELRVKWTTVEPRFADGLLAILLARVQRDFRAAVAAGIFADANLFGIKSTSVEGMQTNYWQPEDFVKSGSASDPDAQGGYTGVEVRAMRRFKRRTVR